MKGNFNSKGYDKTSWYAFVDETHCQNRQIHLTKLSNPFDKIVKPIPDRSTDRSTDTGALPFPGEKFATAWKQWVEHRAEIKKKLTPASIKKQFDFLKSYDVTSAIAIINKSIQNGWRGLFAPDKKELTSGETPNQKMRKFKF